MIHKNRETSLSIMNSWLVCITNVSNLNLSNHLSIGKFFDDLGEIL